MSTSPLEQTIVSSLEAIETLRSLEKPFGKAVELMIESIRAEKKILVCGNGGSAADSSHFTTELLCRFEKDRASLPALSLTNDGSFLTAAGNDYSFDDIFSRQISGLANEGDVIVCFSTSGNSPNIIQALFAAREKKMTTISVLGRDGGRAAGMADVELIVPHAKTSCIQEAHKVLIHAFCRGIEAELFWQGCNSD